MPVFSTTTNQYLKGQESAAPLRNIRKKKFSLKRGYLGCANSANTKKKFLPFLSASSLCARVFGGKGVPLRESSKSMSTQLIHFCK